MDLQTALRTATEQIATASGADPADARLDAEVLLADILGKPRSYLYAFGERPLTLPAQSVFERLITQRSAGVPVAHLVGYREFWSLRLAVNPHTLIPRPDTETLVEVALKRLAPMTGDTLRVLDLGTGTGAIALAIATERRDVHILATDFKAEAVELAEANRAQLAIHNVTVTRSDWFNGITGRFHLIVSNPPYLEAADPHLNQGDLRYEPASALVAGADGLHSLHHIIAEAPRYLEPGGWLLLEHGWTQAAAVRAALDSAGFGAVETCQDLAGRDRVSGGHR